MDSSYQSTRPSIYQLDQEQGIDTATALVASNKDIVTSITDLRLLRDNQGSQGKYNFTLAVLLAVPSSFIYQFIMVRQDYIETQNNCEVSKHTSLSKEGDSSVWYRAV